MIPLSNPRKPRPHDRVADTVAEFVEQTGISKPTAYRMMKDGRLRFVQVTPAMRRIPTSEYRRLGFFAE